MSETSSAAQRPAGAAAPGKEERPRIILVSGAILLALTVAVVLLRFHRLGDLPHGIHHDEGIHGVNALQVLRGEHAVFFPEKNDGLEGLIAYAVALTTPLLGRTVLALRLPSALAGAGTVFAVFWLGRLLFGRDEGGQATPWRGLLIGGVSAGLMAVALGQTIIGRTGFRANFLPLLLCLCFALLWGRWSKPGRSPSAERSAPTEKQRLRRGEGWWRVALAGGCVGLMPYTYIAARFVPFLLLLFGLSCLLSWGRSEAGQKNRRGAPLFLRCSQLFARLRPELWSVGVFLGVAALVAAPILVYFVLHPEDFFGRSGQLSVFAPSISKGDPLGTFLTNIWDHLLVFGLRGDPTWRHNFSGQPMLTPWEAFFFWLGAGLAVWRWRRPAYRLLIFWLGVLLMPAVLALEVGFVPNTLRMMGAAPAVYLIIGVGMWESFRFLEARRRALRFWPLPYSTTQNNERRGSDSADFVFQRDTTRAAIAVGVVVCAVIVGQGAFTYHTLFQKWAGEPEVHYAYEAGGVDLIRVLDMQPPQVDTVYLITYKVNGHPSFEYLYQGETPAYVVHANMPDLAQKIRAMLVAMEQLATVRVVDWNTDAPWAGDGDENIVVLLSRYGRYLGSEDFASFRIHTYADISLDRPWTFYEQLEPLTVRYDGGIDLRGLALGQGEEQLSSQKLLSLEMVRSLWVGLQWQTTPGLDTDFSISLRLYNSDGALSFQRDAVLGNPSLARTSQWAAEEAVDTLFHLELSDDLLPGEYELRMIVYNTETLTPTVEIDVWEPEFVLARLRLAETQ